MQRKSEAAEQKGGSCFYDGIFLGDQTYTKKIVSGCILHTPLSNHFIKILHEFIYLFLDDFVYLLK